MHLGRKVFLSAIFAGLGTRSAAIPTRFSNITFVSWSRQPIATPAYNDVVNTANSLLLHGVGESSRVVPTFNPIATDGKDCHSSRINTADRKLNPSATGQSATQSSKSVHESTLATGWGASDDRGTATQTVSTLQNNGSTSASTTLVGLANILLVHATDTAGQVPTPQSTPGARPDQNVDPSSLSASKQSPHTTLGSLNLDADGRRQMSNNDDNANTIATTIRPTSVMDDTTDSGGRLDNLISAVGDVATLSGADPTALTQGPTASADPTDALDVLLSALPSSVAQSLESQFEATASLSTPTSRPTTRLPITSATPTSSSTSSIPTSTSTSSSITSSSTTFSTSIRPTSSSSTSSSASSTSTNAPPTGSGNLQNSAVAGIATGVTAGAVLIILAVVFFLRRRQQGKAPFGLGPRASQRSKGSGRAYPEVAWLYDPAPTPPNEPSSSHHREESAASLLPQVRQPEMAAYAYGGGLAGHPSRSPELRPARPESPLLPPHMPAVRDESPSGSPSSSPRSSTQSPRRSARSSMNSSAGDGRRPLHAIFEESQAQ